jgi:hypothetical protein
MPTPYESTTLNLKLFELRREPVEAMDSAPDAVIRDSFEPLRPVPHLRANMRAWRISGPSREPKRGRPVRTHQIARA